MTKKLSEMGLTELWHLFPIQLVAHQSVWQQWYQDEATQLKQIIPSSLQIQLNHIGSTAIPNIWAKPIIDILVEMPQSDGLQQIKALLVAKGYLCMAANDQRIDLNKGYTTQGFAPRVFHIHLRVLGDHDEIYFRDYLLAHPEIAKAYEQLKLRLWHDYQFNRDAYTQSKTKFITKYKKLAKAK
ncbi:GrpB family protein [Lactobacillus sp. CC-MHH1034]|uniref:GrpB family protein n=1 Tax=Agrilactobacillus fermenti TaxID=2586909 RepID=UPI001E31F264|nr:GrpB family protein [Agrilactobacillus fermenti]MCD2255481.1 GrpB family protein [Agrilactobacillus fermenti]